MGYVLEGTVRRAGSSLRVTAQLIDAARDAHVWAERFSGTVEDVFQMQERLARRIVEALHVVLTPGEVERLRERPLSDVRALECYHRARQEMYRFTAEGFQRARRLLETGIELVGETPSFVPRRRRHACWPWAAWCS